MRILGIGEYCSLGDLYWRLGLAGHEVRVSVEAPEAHGIFAGVIRRCADWRPQLDWIRSAGEQGVIVFESACHGPLQDALRRDGFAVFGGCALGDRLKIDRAFGQAVLREHGLQTAPCWGFERFDDALEFLSARPGRYVYKLDDPHAASTRTYIGQREDGLDLRARLLHEARHGDEPASPRFVLMQYVHGVEVGVGAYFDGREFLEPALLDWEHKRFFPGDLGELTGEMGTVVTYRGAERLFQRTLAPLAPWLRSAGYRGYLNLNTCVNADGIWPLEFTCRFGVPGYAICDALQLDDWATLLQRVARGHGSRRFSTRSGYALGVVLTVPPFPHEQGYAELWRGLPILIGDRLTEAQRARLHFGEAGLQDGQWVTAGSLGYVGVATGCGPDVETARREAYALAESVVVPNLRYRLDIGERLQRKDLARLQALGWRD